jgi:uncharacterized protein (DUF305 family)
MTTMPSMLRTLRPAPLAAALLALGCAGSGPQPSTPEPQPRVVQPGAPGQATRELDQRQVSELDHPRHTEADIAFMQGMILHHEQAIEMAALVPGRALHDDIALLARRIDISQQDEIALMRRWLADRGVAVEGMGGMADHAHHHLMPGMLTAEQMSGLEAARGAAFDRLFLEMMIQHHEGALTMVAELHAAGGGQESDINQFASHVEADQHIEIQRMQRMLADRR